jgi:TolB protein
LRRWKALLAPLLLACGSDRVSPTEAPVLRDRLVFETGSGIGVMAPDGSERQVLPVGGDLELALNPAVSPDGRRVAFTGSRDGLLDLYVMNVDGSERRQLTSDAARDLRPAWSPGGGRLLFDRTEPAPGSRPVLMLINADGNGRKQLRVDASAAEWSPDGERVAFSGSGTLRGIYVMDQDGGNVTSVSDDCGPGCDDRGPRWSPDGQFLAFTRALPGGTEGVGIMGADGSDARLVLPTLHAAGPVWSPDGQRVALTRLDGSGHIYVLALEGGDTVRLSAGVVTDWTP